VVTGEERIGRARALFAFAGFAAGAAGIFSAAAGTFGGAALGAAAPARAPGVRERAGTAFAVSAAEDGDRFGLDPNG
jgi:hypothetical protein